MLLARIATAFKVVRPRLALAHISAETFLDA
jgi:hypothetical protein